MHHQSVRSPTHGSLSPTKARPTSHGSPTTSSSSRHSHLPPVITTGSGCFVAGDSRIEGTLNLGPGCVLHPRCAVLVGPGATLNMGAGCVVEETAVVRFVGPGTATLGSNNVFMVGCVADLVAGESVGSWNSFSPRSRVEGVRVGDQCTFAAGTAISPSHPYFQALAAKRKANAQTQDGDGDGNGDAHMTTGGGHGSPSASSPPPFVPSRTVIHGATSAARTWDGSGEKQEMAVRAGATAYLTEVLPR